MHHARSTPRRGRPPAVVGSPGTLQRLRRWQSPRPSRSPQPSPTLSRSPQRRIGRLVARISALVGAANRAGVPF